MMNTLFKFKIDYSTYFLILLAFLAGYFKNILLILFIVIFHEFGHIFFFMVFNIKVLKIVIYPFGGITYINKKIHERIYKDLLCSFGGIIFQIILFVIFNFFYKKGIILESTYDLFLIYNKRMLLFNLIPIIPLDGSKIVFYLLTSFISFKHSYLGMIIIGSISFLGFFLYNIIFKMNDFIIYTFLLWKLIEVIKEYKYIMNKFYLERVLYDHYYNRIINNELSISRMKIDKYYYFKEDNRYKNEKDYIKEKLY